MNLSRKNNLVPKALPMRGFFYSPTLDNPLVGLPNVLATPHLGANTDEALRRVGVRMVEDIFTVLDGGKPEHTYSLYGTRTN